MERWALCWPTVARADDLTRFRSLAATCAHSKRERNKKRWVVSLNAYVARVARHEPWLLLRLHVAALKIACVTGEDLLHSRWHLGRCRDAILVLPIARTRGTRVN